MENASLKKEAIKKPKLWQKFISRPESSAVIALVLLVLVFSTTTNTFLTKINVFNVLRNGALYIFVALGQSMVLVVGGMNVSLGAIGGLSTVMCGITLQNLGMPALPAVIITLALGCVLGLANGLIITKIHINPFVTTLATSFAYTGLVYGISKGYPYAYIPKNFTILGRGGIGGVPYLFLLAVGVLIILGLMFRYSTIGRKILATGGSKEAAQLSGIKTDNIILLANSLSGFFAALAAVLWVSRMGSAPPGTGTDWVMISFAVAIIGGTALSGGVFTSIGFVCSGIMLAIIKNGLIMLEVNIYFEQTFLGLFILAAVAVESVRMRYAVKVTSGEN